jgi:hypothetical protein
LSTAIQGRNAGTGQSAEQTGVGPQIRKTRNKTKRTVKAAEPRIRGTIVDSGEGGFSIIHGGGLFSFFKGVVHGLNDFFRRKRLRENGPGSQPSGGLQEDFRVRGMAGNNDHLGRVLHPAKVKSCLQAFLLRHEQVGYHHVGGSGAKMFEAFFAVLGLVNFVTVLFQPATKHRPDRGIIVNEEDASHAESVRYGSFGNAVTVRSQAGAAQYGAKPVETQEGKARMAQIEKK